MRIRQSLHDANTAFPEVEKWKEFYNFWHSIINSPTESYLRRSTFDLIGPSLLPGPSLPNTPSDYAISVIHRRGGLAL